MMGSLSEEEKVRISSRRTEPSLICMHFDVPPDLCIARRGARVQVALAIRVLSGCYDAGLVGDAIASVLVDHAKVHFSNLVMSYPLTSLRPLLHASTHLNPACRAKTSRHEKTIRAVGERLNAYADPDWYPPPDDPKSIMDFQVCSRRLVLQYTVALTQACASATRGHHLTTSRVFTRLPGTPSAAQRAGQQLEWGQRCSAWRRPGRPWWQGRR